MIAPAPSQDEILQQLERILSSEFFRAGGRSSLLLSYLAEHTLGENPERLKEYTIGAEALGRGDSFDPRIDSIVRVEASRLRTKLEQYFAAEGKSDPLLIRLPKGGYGLVFEKHSGAKALEPPPRPEVSAKLISPVLAILLVLAIWRPWQADLAQQQRPLVQLEAELATGGELGSIVGTHLVLSPDGARIVFVAINTDGVSQLHTRRLDHLQITLLHGTEGARNPFFSPDGRWIAFLADRKLKKMPITGGSPIILCDAADIMGGSWGDNDNLIVSLPGQPKLWLVSSSGGVPRSVDLPLEVNRAAWPQVLPHSKAVLYTASGDGGADTARIEVVLIASGERKTLVKGGTFGRYLPSGHLVYINQGTMYAVAFDIAQLAVTGSPVPVVSNVEYNSVFGFAQFDFSQTGILAYRRSSVRGEIAVKWIESNGQTTPIFPGTGPYLWPRLSPDGSKLALVRFDSGGTQLWVKEIKEGSLTPLSSVSKTQMAPLWTPGGRFVIYAEGKSINWMAAAQGGKKGTLLRNRNIQIPWSLSPGGRQLAFHALDSATHFDLWTVPLKEENGELRAGEPEPILRTPAVESFPSFSPDGRWLAYTSTSSGVYEVYVAAFPFSAPHVQVSRGGGRCPRWWSGGGKILYSSLDRRLMAAPYRIKNGRFQADSPRVWSKVQLADTNVLPNFDVANDGRVVALLPPDSAPHQAGNHVTFVMNFFDEVNRRLGSM